MSIKTTQDLFALFRQHQLFERFGLQRIGVFGSLSRGEAFNDIDLLIEDDLDYQTLLALKKQVEALTGCKVDVVQEKYAEPVVLHRALKEALYATAA